MAVESTTAADIVFLAGAYAMVFSQEWYVRLLVDNKNWGKLL